MPLSDDQINKLLAMIANTTADSLDCDSCSNLLAQFAEIRLQSKEIPDAMREVETHLEQCGCCQDEFSALLDGLRALDDL